MSTKADVNNWTEEQEKTYQARMRKEGEAVVKAREKICAACNDADSHLCPCDPV
jgi:hypothetical protein